MSPELEILRERTRIQACEDILRDVDKRCSGMSPVEVTETIHRASIELLHAVEQLLFSLYYDHTDHRAADTVKDCLTDAREEIDGYLEAWREQQITGDYLDKLKAAE